MIELSINLSSATGFSGNQAWVKINADELKQLARGISSPTKQKELKTLLSKFQNFNSHLPSSDLTATGPKELAASEIPQNVRAEGEELLRKNIIWEKNNRQYIAKIKGTNGNYTKVITVPLYPNNPVYQGFLVSITKTQGINTNESENQHYIRKAKLQNLAKGTSSPQTQAELIKLSKANNMF